MTGGKSPNIPVSWGELLDKISILEIKRHRIRDLAARANVTKEHRLLCSVAGPAMRDEAIVPLLDELRSINRQLWDTEDAIRREESRAVFGAAFVELARSVYKKNDRRAALKRAINLQLRSELVEEKSYCETSALPHGSISAGRAPVFRSTRG